MKSRRFFYPRRATNNRFEWRMQIQSLVPSSRLSSSSRLSHSFPVSRRRFNWHGRSYTRSHRADKDQSMTISFSPPKRQRNNLLRGKVRLSSLPIERREGAADWIPILSR